jgi:hypothetical protein
MNLVAIMPVRNEDWILGLSARVALMWCDRLVILNHASTDGTDRIIGELAGEFGNRVVSVLNPNTRWDEMADRQWLLGFARANGGDTGATHIALIDADEILTGNLVGSIRQQVQALTLGQMLTLPLYNLRGGLDRYHENGVWGQRKVSVAFKDVNTAAWRGNTFHKREPEGVQWLRSNMRNVRQGEGGVMHLWGALERRLIAKHALYKVNERLYYPGKPVAEIDRMYSWAIKGDTEPPYQNYGTPETWTYSDVPQAWWKPYDSFRMNANADIWQETEVRRLVAEHGRETFAGLDLFGLA